MNWPVRLRNWAWVIELSEPIVLFDACVLYPAPLRDLLMHLAVAGIFRARWTEAIHDEWTRNVLKNRPDLRFEQLMRTRELMNAHVLDSLVKGYENLIESIVLPDPNDRHVLAAAIRSDTKIILTFNIKDIPESSLSPYDIIAISPDIFLVQCLERAAGNVLKAVRRHRASLKNPPKSVNDYLVTIESNGLKRFVSELRKSENNI
ncbi:MAG: PIN domain-containing protein [bacterium]